MKPSQLLPLYAAAALAHNSGSSAHHHHHHHDLAGVCGSGALPLDGESVCHSDSRYLGGGERPIFAQKPFESWRCPNGTDCDYAHKYAWTYSTPCFKGSLSGEEYCAITDTTFAEGRGISMVMPKRRADFIATNPAFTEPEQIAGVNQDLVRTIPAKYDLQEFPGKGMGLVANQFIRRGDLIMANTASLMIDYRVFDELTKDEYKELQVHAVDNLPSPHRAAFLNLSTHGQTFQSHVDLVEKIGETNAFDIDPDDDDPEQEKGFFVVFPEIARFNHDCRPNADYYFSHGAMTQYIHATRDIQKGEELTLSYINGMMKREDRLARLKRNWGFQCACPLCTQDRPRVEASDARIRQINTLRPKLRRWKADSPANPQMAELFVSLHEQEQLWGSMYNAYTFAALEYNAVGDPWTAIRYAQLAIEWGIPVIGERAEDMVEMKKMAEDPWSHWSWQLRNKRKGGWGKENLAEVIDDDDD